MHSYMVECSGKKVRNFSGHNAWYNTAPVTHGSLGYYNTNDYKLKANSLFKSSGFLSC